MIYIYISSKIDIDISGSVLYSKILKTENQEKALSMGE